MSLLNHGSPPPTSTAFPRMTGQYLARAALTRRQRAKLAAALSKGTTVVAPLTVKQSAALARVSVADVSKARNGKHGNGRSNGHAESLADHIARSSPAERLAAARIVGPAELWDTMISPVISEERAATAQAAE